MLPFACPKLGGTNYLDGRLLEHPDIQIDKSNIHYSPSVKCQPK